MERVLKVYTDTEGPNPYFLRALRELLTKYDYPFGEYDHTRFEPFKKIIEKEFSAIFSEEDYTLTFATQKQKQLFLLKFY